MAGEDLRLLGATLSPFVIRARIAFNLKGVEYEFVEENLRNKSELLIKSNPVYKKVPVLIHHGKPICESMIIVQYIDEVWAESGPSILPSDAYDRAVARFWAHYIDDKFFASLFGIVRAKTEEAKAESTENTVAILLLLEETFEKLSNGKKFFGGETIGYIDIALGCNLGWIAAAEELCGIELLVDSKTPRLVKWAGNFKSSDAVVKDALPETEKFVEFGKVLQAM